jgi:hypothetical protein
MASPTTRRHIKALEAFQTTSDKSSSSLWFHSGKILLGSRRVGWRAASEAAGEFLLSLPFRFAPSLCLIITVLFLYVVACVQLVISLLILLPDDAFINSPRFC